MIAGKRIDTARLKQAYPVAELIAQYHIPVRPSGRALVARCPFHTDRGRPNLYVYPDTQSWYCYRCGAGGDIFDFIQRYEGLDFRAAVARLSGQPDGPDRSAHAPARVPVEEAAPPALDVESLACLAAATRLYHHRLHRTPAACAYLAERGIDPAIRDACRIGFAAGGDLVPYLRRCGLGIDAATRAGLFTPAAHEALAGRIVVPAIQDGHPTWLIGRALPGGARGPKYLGLAGHKTLLGWESTTGSRAVVITEGVFDYLVLRGWQLPALAICGTHLRAEALAEIERFSCVYLALDTDPAGRSATTRLCEALAPRARPVRLPAGWKDVAELAIQPGGKAIFLEALAAARQASSGIPAEQPNGNSRMVLTHPAVSVSAVDDCTASV